MGSTETSPRSGTTTSIIGGRKDRHRLSGSQGRARSFAWSSSHGRSSVASCSGQSIIRLGAAASSIGSRGRRLCLCRRSGESRRAGRHGRRQRCWACQRRYGGVSGSTLEPRGRPSLNPPPGRSRSSPGSLRSSRRPEAIVFSPTFVCTPLLRGDLIITLRRLNARPRTIRQMRRLGSGEGLYSCVLVCPTRKAPVSTNEVST
jgi:hypothetical protein